MPSVVVINRLVPDEAMQNGKFASVIRESVPCPVTVSYLPILSGNATNRFCPAESTAIPRGSISPVTKLRLTSNPDVVYAEMEPALKSPMNKRDP